MYPLKYSEIAQYEIFTKRLLILGLVETKKTDN